MKSKLWTLICQMSPMLFPLDAQAGQAIVLQRGLPTDIWLTWPDGERLNEPGLIEVFPEYRQTAKGDEFQLAKAAGFDFVRLTIDPAIFLANPSPASTEKLLAGVTKAISEIRAADLKVLVDLHAFPKDGGGMGTNQIVADEKSFARFLAVVEKVGETLSAQPADQVGFELLNEPTLDCPEDLEGGKTPRWPAMLKQMHQTARAAAPRLTLVLSGGCWGGPDGLVALDPADIADANVMWSFHNYEPFVFTHQSATWTKWYVEYIEGLRFPPQPAQKRKIMSAVAQRIAKAGIPAKTRKQWLIDAKNDLNAYFDGTWAVERALMPFVKVDAWVAKHGIAPGAILLGEFGATRPEVGTAAAQPSRYAYYALIAKEASKRGYAWSTWSWSGGMGVSEAFDGRRIDPAMVKALGLPKP